MRRPRFLAFGLVFAILSPCLAKETVYLKTGFSFEVESHVLEDGAFLCHVGTGTLEFPANDVLRIEALPEAKNSQLPSAVVSDSSQTPEQILNEAAYLQGLDEDFVRSVAKVESGLRQEAVSRKGAIGLMQLMPGTAAELGVRPDQPLDNAKGGAKYLRELLIRYHGNSVLALAAYNAGPEAVARYGGVPPYAETQHYVMLVLREYNRQVKARAQSTAQTVRASKPSATN